MQRRPVNPKAVVMLSVFFTSFSAIFIRLSDAPSTAIAAWRMIFSVFLIAPLLAVERARSPEQKETSRLLPRGSDLVLCVLSGIFLAAHFGAWIESVKHTTIASATVLVNTHPFFVVSFGFLFLGERLSRRSLLFVAAALAGTFVLSYGDLALGPEALRGDLLALTGAVSVSGYMIVGRVVRRRVPAMMYVVIVYSVSAVLLVAFAAAAGVRLAPYPAKELAIFFGLAFFCTLLGHTLFNWALKHLTASFVSTAILSEPVYATLMGIVIFAEIPPITAIAGGTVVLLSLFGFLRNEARVEAARMAGHNHFDSKAGSWDDERHRRRNDAVADAIRELVPLGPSTRLMDFGAGTGLLSLRLAPYVGSVVAVDTSGGMIEQLRSKLDGETKVEALLHDLAAEPLQGRSFDVVVSAMTLHHVDDVSNILKRFHEHLVPGGRIAIADLEKEDGSFHGGGTQAHHHGFDPQELGTVAERAGFREVSHRRIYTIERDKGEGPSQFPVFLLTALR